jgi:hypothetical protein
MQNQSQYQKYTNDLRNDKNHIQRKLQQEIAAENKHKVSISNEILSTQPNKPSNHQQHRRPRVIEISGLTGHRTQEEPESLQEGFTGLGNILNQTPSYHFNNDFYSPGLLREQVSKDRSDEFRKYIDNERQEEEQLRQLAVSESDLMKTNQFSGASKQFLDPMAKVDTTKDPLNQPYEDKRYNKVRKSVVNIDSGHRDLSRYPNSNNYKIQLPRSYQHVKEVSLVSSEIPNTDRVVRDDPADVKRSKNRRKVQCGELLNDANNNFYWILAEDADIGWDCLIYNAPLTPGNYVAQDCNCGEKTIQEEIQERVAGVNHYKDGTPATFLVDIDTRTNIVTIQSIESSILELNPLATQVATNILTVTHVNHGFSVGDKVTILGATSVGDVPEGQLNKTHTVETIIDVNTFEVRINAIASSTSVGGGSNVTSGIEKPMKLLFSNVDTIGKILGFPQQDSSDPLSKNIEFIDTDPVDSFGLPTVAGKVPAQIKTTNHRLIPGDTILISDTNTIPDISGIQTVTKVITADLFEIGIPIKIVNNQTVTDSTRIGKVKQSLDNQLTTVTNIDPSVIGFIQLGNIHQLDLNDTIFIANVVSGVLVGGNPISGIHTVTILPSSTSFGVESKIEYQGNFGNAFVFQTTSTEVIPISGIVPQNNGVFTPYPVEPIFSGTNIPEYVLLKNFSIIPDLNIDVEVDVDAVFECSVTTTTIFASQTFLTNCTCQKKMLNIWIRVGNPSSTGVFATMDIYNADTTTLLGSLTSVAVVNETAVGTNFSVSSDADIIFQPGTTYQWILNVSGGTVDICGNSGNLYPDGTSNLADPNHDYEFRVYVSADIQKVSTYSITTGRFDLRNKILDVTLENVSQVYLRSLDPQLRFIKDATIKSNGLIRYTVQHGMLSGDKFYVRRFTKPYRTTENIISPNLIGIQQVNTKQNNFRFDITTPITSSTYATSTLINNLVTIKTLDESPTNIQNIYPQSNGYLCKDRQTCDTASRQQCILCPGDFIYIRNSELIDCGNDITPVSQPLEGCYSINQIYSDTSLVCDDIFDLGNVVKGNVLTSNLGECARLDSFNGVDGQNGTFNLATIFFTPVTTVTPAAAQIWVLDLSTTLIPGWTGLTGTSSIAKSDIDQKYFILPTPAGTRGIWFRAGPTITAPAGAMAANFQDQVFLDNNMLPPTITINQIGSQINLMAIGSVGQWSVSSFYTEFDSNLSNHPTFTFIAQSDGPPLGGPAGGTFVNVLAIGSIQDGATGSTVTSPSAGALCIQTEVPHLLELGDAIYYTIYANNCQISSGNTLPLIPASGVFAANVISAVLNLNDTIQFVVPDADATVFKIYGAGVVSSSFGSLGVKDIQFYYHKICGSVFTPIEKFFPNTYCGMIESLSHNVTNSSNIYLGQTTVTPDINGYIDSANLVVLDNNFIAILNPCITTGNVGSSFAGEFVFPVGDESTEITPFDIGAQNNGVIIADNVFFGGEQVYFTNDTNINIGIAGEMRNRIFTVSNDNLTNEQFGVVETSILSLDELLGPPVQMTQEVMQSTPGEYYITVPSGTVKLDIEELFGAGGGRGQSASPGTCIGGTGGNLTASFTVGSGLDIEVGDILKYTIGSKGDSGASGGAGGLFGKGGSADQGGTAFKLGGGGGGYSSIYNDTKGIYIAVVGGGGGGGVNVTTLIFPNGGHGSGTNVGFDGDDAVGSVTGGKKGNTSTLTVGVGGVGEAGINNPAADGGTANSLFGGGDGAGGFGGYYDAGGVGVDLGGGGGGGGYFGGGGGGGRINNINTAAAGGGGSGFLRLTATTFTKGSSGSAEGTDGYIKFVFTQNIVGFGAGHFVEIPVDDTEHGIFTVEPNSNATFISSQVTGFPALPASTQILLTDNSYGDSDIAQVKDIITQASAFKSPAPSYSPTAFITNEVVTVTNIDLGTGVLQNNKVDIISTSDARFPGLNGLGWILVSGNIEPIVTIVRDSTGKVEPVNADLKIGDKVHFVSTHPTTPDINGTYTVRYIDLGNVVPTFFELSDLTITNDGGNLANASTNIVYFRTTITGNTSDGCITINEISTGCPTVITATAHGLPIGSNVNVVVLNTDTIPPIDIANAGVIINTVVTSEDLLSLPKTDLNTTGNVINLCNLNVVNQTNLFITQQGRWSQELLSTNCGTAILSTDLANAQTIVTTTSRKNVKEFVMFEIVNSNPTTIGSTTITVTLPTGLTSLPIKNGQTVTISGHINANPPIDGSFKVFQVTPTTFKIPLNTIASSTGGTGGYATIVAPSNIPGHGLYTGNKIMFENVRSEPDINEKQFEITVIDDNRFSIPIVLESFNNAQPGRWCTNMVNLEFVDHGFKTGDLFFMYGATRFGGLFEEDINTYHGEKRQNIVTTEEKQTRKYATVIDGNNLQFEAITFPSDRVLGGGFDICISAHNANTSQQALGYKNYGFNAQQTNLNCNGTLNNFIDLQQEPYILMTSDKLTNILTTGNAVDKIFAKIQLTSKPGTMLYDTFITSPKVYDNPDKTLEEIDIQFYRRDGKPFDFLGMDHSFSLEITEYQDRLLGTNIQSGRSIADRGPVSQQGFVESTISGFHPEQNVLTPSQLAGAFNGN